MSKRTLLLIVILTVITAGLLILAVSSQHEEAPQLANTSPSPTTAPATVILGLTQSTPATGGVKSVDLNVDSGASKVTGVQIELAYDPNVLTNVTVTPGAYIQNPVVLFNRVDQKNGRITFAEGVSPTGAESVGISGTGVAAVIKYSVSPGATGSTTTLHFLSKTVVTAEGVTTSVLKSTSDLTLPLK